MCGVTALRGHGVGLLPYEAMVCGVTALRGHGVWGYCLTRSWYVGLLP